MDGRNPAPCLLPCQRHGNALFVGVYRESSFRGVLRRCRISSVCSLQVQSFFTFGAVGVLARYMQKQQQEHEDPFYRPGFEVAMGWARNTGQALRYLHGLPTPIIHRDLKPLNLFLTKDLQVKAGIVSKWGTLNLLLSFWFPIEPS